MKDITSKIDSNLQIGENYYQLVLRTGWSSFHSGQFVMVKIPTNEVFLRRPFSISEGIDKDSISIIYKKVGPGTDHLSTMQTGDNLNVLGPLGNGFKPLPHPGGAAHLRGAQAVMVAGGFGIAPFVGLAKEFADKGIKASLFYGGRTKEDILLIDRFKEMGVSVNISTEDGSLGERGIVTELLLKDTSNLLKNSEIFCCGPHGLTEAVINIAKEHNVPAQVSFETYMGCGIGVCLGCAVKTKDGYKRACKEGPVFDIKELA